MQTFSSFFRLTRIRRRMFQPTEPKVSCNDLSALVTYKYVSSVSSSTHL
jgi:hypothetical protein